MQRLVAGVVAAVLPAVTNVFQKAENQETGHMPCFGGVPWLRQVGLLCGSGSTPQERNQGETGLAIGASGIEDRSR